MFLISFITQAVKQFNPIFLSLTFAAIFYLVYLNFEELKYQFKEVTPVTWVLLALIFLTGLYTCHNFSEPTSVTGKLWTHANIAENIKDNYTTYMARSIHRPEAYPFLLFLAFSLFGESISVISNMGIFFTAATSIIIFASVYLITKKELYGLISALLFVLFPLPVIKSQHGSVLPLYGLLAAMALFFLAFSLRTKKVKSITLALLVYISCLATRIEALYLSGLFILAYLFFLKRDSKKLLTPILIGMVFALQVVPFLVISPGVFGYNLNRNRPQTEFFREKYPNAAKSTFSLDHLPRNFRWMKEVMFRRGFFNLFSLLFFLFGLISIRYCKLASLPIIWIALFFLFFGTWFGTAIVSMTLHLLQVYIPISMVIGIGIGSASEKLLKLLEENIKSIKISSTFQFVITFLLALLIFAPSINSYYFGHDHKKEEDFYRDVQTVLENAGSNACVLVEDKEIGHRVYPEDLIRYSTDKEVRTDPRKCQSEELYYVKLKEKAHPKELSKDYFSLFRSLKQRCKLQRLEKLQTLSLFGVKC